MKVLIQRAELAQIGYIPSEYEGGLQFVKPEKLNGDIPVDTQSVIEQADQMTDEEMESVKLN